MTTESAPSYPATLRIDYPDRDLNKLSTFLRIFYAIPIVIVLSLLPAALTAIFLLIVFRHKYPRWWFDFTQELARFGTRVGAYLALMTDEYPSTDEHQNVHLQLDYPNAKEDLNRWLPLVKWVLAIPHFIVLFFLGIAVFFSVIFAWFAILFTGRYPPSIFGFVEGFLRWALRVEAYAFFLTTDQYPPFSLD